MKLQFDAQQQFQIDAVNAVVDIFDGQPLHQGDFEIRFETSYEGVLSGQVQTELGMGNRLLLNDETMLANVHQIQDVNAIDRIPALQDYHFSVEMETGTGKTYVYLRTIFELSRKYGFKKYVIVVPSVVIREGVLKNLEITKDHFKALFNNIEYEYFVYDSQKINRLRKFAEELDRREGIKLFVKLPGWFKVETPIGEYNPDWAILKRDDTVLYLVRETKGTKDFEKLRNAEAEKIRCGRRHFEALGGVDFDVVVTAGEV